MGFNNEGVKAAAERLRNRESDVIIGGNIGKNKVTPNENAIDDYEICFKELFPVVDYFVVNVSSPNTPNLRELQKRTTAKAVASFAKFKLELPQSQTDIAQNSARFNQRTIG